MKKFGRIRFKIQNLYVKMAMVKNVYEIVDDTNDLRERIHKSIKTKRNKLRIGEVAGWHDKSLALQADLAKKLDELYERFVRLEDEVRKGRFRPEMLRKGKR
jgi:hypothetical protein